MPSGSEAAASVRALSVTFPGGIAVLDGIDLDLAPGRVTAIIGPNGSGKTTLLRVIAGRLAPTSGKVTVLGADVDRDRPRARIGFVSQEIALDPEMTGWETLRLLGVLYGLPEPRLAGTIDRLADSFGLAGDLARAVRTYSGGMRRRLHVVLGILHEPELLLFDEPTAGLDPSGRASFWSATRRFAAAGKTTAVAMHDLADVEEHCDVVAVLGRRKLLACAPPRELIAAHARRTLELTASAPVPMLEAARAALESIAGIAEVKSSGGEILLAIGDGDRRIRDRVLSALEATGIEVTSFRIREPSLAGAYFALTGERLPASPPAIARREGPAGVDREVLP